MSRQDNKPLGITLDAASRKAIVNEVLAAIRGDSCSNAACPLTAQSKPTDTDYANAVDEITNWRSYTNLRDTNTFSLDEVISIPANVVFDLKLSLSETNLHANNATFGFDSAANITYNIRDVDVLRPLNKSFDLREQAEADTDTIDISGLAIKPFLKLDEIQSWFHDVKEAYTTFANELKAYCSNKNLDFDTVLYRLEFD